MTQACACLQSRVLHGVRQEILALSEIPFVKVSHESWHGCETNSSYLPAVHATLLDGQAAASLSFRRDCTLT